VTRLLTVNIIWKLSVSNEEWQFLWRISYMVDTGNPQGKRRAHGHVEPFLHNPVLKEDHELSEVQWLKEQPTTESRKRLRT